MPRVVPDQKNKYETDELFKKLSQDVDVSPARNLLAGAPLNIIIVLHQSSIRIP